MDAAATLSQGAGDAKSRRQWAEETRPSFIAGLRRGDRTIALPALAEAYRAPLFEFFCLRGCPRSEAHDVTQAFFVFMMRPGFFAGYDPARGPFRSWLRGVAKHFYWDWWRRLNAVPLPRDPADVAETLERSERSEEAASAVDRRFDAGFTRIVVARALERLRPHYADAQLFEDLYQAVLGARRTPDYAAMAEREGKSVAALKGAWLRKKDRWKLRFWACLRDELAALGMRKRGSIHSVVAELLDACE